MLSLTNRAITNSARRYCACHSVVLLGIYALLCTLIIIYMVGRARNGTVTDDLPDTQAEVEWDDFAVNLLDRQLSYRMVRPANGDGCNGSKLLVMVPTRPAALSVRASIRDSWAAHHIVQKIGATVKFVVGRTKKNTALEEFILDELNTKQDLILTDIADTYNTLNLKMYAAFQWQISYCPTVDFVVKADDDVVMDLERLMHWIDHLFLDLARENPFAIFGHLLHKTKVIRDPTVKWYVPKRMLSDDTYPDYTIGMAYMLTGPTAQKLIENSSHIGIFPFEDVLFTGMIAKSTNVPRIDASKIFRSSREIHDREECNDSVPLLSCVYGYDADQIPIIYRKLHNLTCIV